MRVRLDHPGHEHAALSVRHLGIGRHQLLGVTGNSVYLRSPDPHRTCKQVIARTVKYADVIENDCVL